MILMFYLLFISYSDLFYLLTVGERVIILHVILLHDTRTHTHTGKTPLDEGSALRIDLYLITHNTHKKEDIHASGGIRTRNSSKRAAAVLQFKRRGHLEWQKFLIFKQFYSFSVLLHYIMRCRTRGATFNFQKCLVESAFN